MSTKNVLSMDSKKRGIFLLGSILIGLILSSTLVSAASLYSFAGTIGGLYKQFYGWIDFAIFFMVFTVLARVTLEKVFAKENDTRTQKIIAPLYLATGLALSLGLALYTTANNITLMSIGPLAGILLILALIGWGFTLIKGKKLGKTGKWLAIIAFLLVLLALLLATLYFYPQVWGIIPGGWGDEILSFLIGALIVGALIWLLIKAFKGSKPGESGEGSLLDNDFIKWALIILGILAALALLGYLLYLFWQFIKPWLIYFLIALAILLGLYLLSRLLKALNIGLGMKIALRYDPHYGKANAPTYIQGQHDNVKLTAIVVDPKASDRLTYQWKSKHPGLTFSGQGSQTINFNVNNIRLLAAYPGQRELIRVEVTVNDLERKKRGRKVAKFWITAKPGEEDPKEIEKHNKVTIKKPVKGKETKTVEWNTPLSFECRALGPKIAGVRWTYLKDHTVSEGDIPRSMRNSFGNTLAFKIPFLPREGPGEYTIFCIGIDSTGNPLPRVYDLIFINTGKEGEKIFITHPVGSRSKHKLRKRTPTKFSYVIKKNKKGGWFS